MRNFGPGVIEPSRRLLSPETREKTGMREFFDVDLESRVISMPASSDQIGLHENFQQENFAVLDSQPDDSGLLLIVPDGAQTIRQVLKSVSQDVVRYRPLFLRVGIELGGLASRGYGLEPHTPQTVLNSIAFAPTNLGDFAESVFFIPPYTITRDTSVEESNKNIHRELYNSSYFTPEAARELMWQILLGMGV